MNYFEILAGQILARAKISILLVDGQNFSRRNQRPKFFREGPSKLDISKNRREPIKTHDARPSAMPIGKSPPPAAPGLPNAPLLLLSSTIFRRNMHPDRFRNRFGAFTSAICFRNLNFGEMRMISAPKWSQNRPKCLSDRGVTLYSFFK